MSKTEPIIDPTRCSLDELARQAQLGDQEAFQHIMQRSNQRLFRVARAVLNDDDDAEDALQDAYISAYRHLDAFRGDAGLTTWLTRIVLNACYARRRAQRPSVDLETLDTAAGESHVIAFPTRYGMEDPSLAASRGQLRDMVEEAVSALPEPFRVVFMLRDIEGCSAEETAETLGIRAETVKTRLFRARRRLREAMSEKLAVSVGEAFPFMGARCARLTSRVMQRLAADLGTDGTRH